MKIEQILYNINIIKNQKHKTYKYFPKNKEELIDLINNQHVNLGDINVSNITDMSNLFNNSKRKDFSGIEEWDVSNVVYMDNMFYGCTNFNQSLEKWNMSNEASKHHMSKHKNTNKI
ncbi:BspA family leucine-rich repeat surface protein [Campylobacter lari]|nr:BspA family leucine-rich repeat surface protein [Campylobacter lari]